MGRDSGVRWNLTKIEAIRRNILYIHLVAEDTSTTTDLLHIKYIHTKYVFQTVKSRISLT